MAENAKTLNFKKQIEMLKSTDASKFEEWTFFGSHRFLDGEPGVSNHKVGFAPSLDLAVLFYDV